jgi:hypothetical protein
VKKKHITTDDQERGKRVDPVAVGTSIARVWSWANDPANLTDSLAADVRVLLTQARRLADRTPAAEKLHADLANHKAWNRALHRKLAALRRELDEARRQAPAAATN